MRILDLRMVRTKPFGVNPSKKTGQTWGVMGFDTETDNGQVTIITDNQGRYSIIEKQEDILNYIMYKNYRNKINFFFNLEYDSNAIIKLFDRKKIGELIKYNEVIIHGEDNDYVVRIVPKKCLKISRISRTGNKNKLKDGVKFFDISTFYKIGSLEKTYNKTFICHANKYKCIDKNLEYLVKKCEDCYYHKVCMEKGGFKKSLDASKQFPLNKINEEDIDYCINDSIACYKLAENIVKMTNKLVTLKDYYSPASIAKALIRQKLKYPYKFNTKEEIQRIGLKTYGGGRFEMIKRGTFEKGTYIVDINSAYPEEIHKLKEAIGWTSNNKRYEENSMYSFFNCNVKIDEETISPLKVFSKKLGILTYPNGKFTNIDITKSEYDIIEKMGYDIEILHAEHMFNESPNYPFKWVKNIYNLRRKYKNPDDYNRLEHILKLVMNSIYGCTIQTTVKYEIEKKDKKANDLEIIMDEVIYCSKCEKEIYPDTNSLKICPTCKGYLEMLIRRKRYYAGQFYNPIYATTITANTRSKLIEDAFLNKKKMEKHIIMFATDSITYDKKPNHLTIGKDMGEYSISDELSGTFLGSGIYELEDKKGNIFKNKQRFRGFGDISIKNIMQENPTLDQYIYRKYAPRKLKESKNDLENLNVFPVNGKEKRLMLNFDKKRIWDRDIKSFKDLMETQINSIPLNIIQEIN